jgi:LysM repeat protein
VPYFSHIPTGTVVATGDFGPSGAVHGSVKVVKTESDYMLQLSDFAAPAGDELKISARETRPGCYDSWGLAFGDPSSWTSPDIPNKITGLHLRLLLEPDGSRPDLLDPTFFTTVVVTAGAMGTVTNGANGSPSRYLIASGDTLAQVSKRFDLTLDDVYYLNPTRLSTQSTQINAGDDLNLSASARGS